MPKVLLITSLADAIVEELLVSAPGCIEADACPASAASGKQAERAASAQYLMLFPARLPDPVLQAARELEFVQLLTAGFDSIDLEACRKRGVMVANNGGANSIDVAEHAVALMLAVYRRLVELDADTRAGNSGRFDTGLSTYTLAGKTIGLVGMGNIGQQTARRLVGFDCNLIYSDIAAAAAEVEERLGLHRVSFSQLLQQSDVVSLHLPLNDSTRGMLGSDEFATMKEGAVLINTCRGPVVDEPHLIAALESGRLRGAGLDVFVEEPPGTDNPLIAMKNVVVTPHVAGVTRDTWARRARFAFANMERVSRGEDPLSRVV